jgi:hypothetical protein
MIVVFAMLATFKSFANPCENQITPTQEPSVPTPEPQSPPQLLNYILTVTCHPDVTTLIAGCDSPSNRFVEDDLKPFLRAFGNPEDCHFNVIEPMNMIILVLPPEWNVTFEQLKKIEAGPLKVVSAVTIEEDFGATTAQK